MPKASDVLIMLLPEGGWATYGDTYEDIVFLEAKPLTKEQFEAGVAKYDSWKSAKDAKIESDKMALLNKLGISLDELRSLFS
jgi:hypothetical protein